MLKAKNVIAAVHAIARAPAFADFKSRSTWSGFIYELQIMFNNLNSNKMFHTIKNENPGVKSQFHSYLMPVKSQPKVVEYNLEASVFNREIAPGKTIEAWGSVQSEFKI